MSIFCKGSVYVIAKINKICNAQLCSNFFYKGVNDRAQSLPQVVDLMIDLTSFQVKFYWMDTLSVLRLSFRLSWTGYVVIWYKLTLFRLSGSLQPVHHFLPSASVLGSEFIQIPFLSFQRSQQVHLQMTHIKLLLIPMFIFNFVMAKKCIANKFQL